MSKSGQILMTPCLRDFGIPEPLSYIARLECHVADSNQVINRGDPLITFHFDQFEQEPSDKSSWKFWKNNDSIAVNSFTLVSPCAGVSGAFSSTRARTKERGGSGFLYNGLIEERLHLPEIILAQGEGLSSEDHQVFERFAATIFGYLKHNYGLNAHNLGSVGEYRTVRLSSVSDEEFGQAYCFFNCSHSLSGAVAELTRGLIKPASRWTLKV